MGERLLRHLVRLTTTNTTGTDYDWCVAGNSTNKRQLIKSAIIRNNTTTSKICTVKLKVSSTSLFQAKYTIPSSSYGVAVDFYDQVIYGSPVTADAITLSFAGAALKPSRPISLIATAVEFTTST